LLALQLVDLKCCLGFGASGHIGSITWIIFENYGGFSSRITIQLVAKLVFER
jgi:hypothetical protein